MNRNSIWRALIAGSALLTFSCDSSRTTEPLRDAPTATRAPLIFPSSVKPFACPTNESDSATSLIGALGGLLSAGGTTVLIPAGALLGDQTVTLTVPSSTYVEIDVSVAGSEHFIFELPITVTVSYARCSRSNIGFSTISAWYWNPATGDLLEEMPSIDNKLLQTVTFTTGHLSGYVLAN